MHTEVERQPIKCAAQKFDGSLINVGHDLMTHCILDDFLNQASLTKIYVPLMKLH